MRLFFALWPPPATASALEAWAHEVRRQTGGRVIPAPNLHLTLAFLGEAERRLAEAAARGIVGTAHDLPLDEARHVKRNQMVWAQPRAVPMPLARLADDLRRALAAAGFTLEARAFSAHVTLIRKARAPGILAGLPPVRWPVEAFSLVASSTARDGARYERLETFTLAPERAAG